MKHLFTSEKKRPSAKTIYFIKKWHTPIVHSITMNPIRRIMSTRIQTTIGSKYQSK